MTVEMFSRLTSQMLHHVLIVVIMFQNILIPEWIASEMHAGKANMRHKEGTIQL